LLNVALVATCALVIGAITASASFGVDTLRHARADDEYHAAKASYARGDFKRAGESAGRSLALHPGNAEASALLGRSLESRGDIAGAAQAYSESLRCDPSQSEVRFRLAVMCMAAGRTAMAARELEKVLATDKDNVGAMLLLARTYEGQGRSDEAVVLYERVVKLHPAGIDVKWVEERLKALP
jgi:cytochrome c-type biogenesis protein CcmH/NrfG